MGKIVDFLASGAAISQNLNTGFTSFETDAVQITPNNVQGILTIQFATTTAAGDAQFKIQQSIDGTLYDYLRDIYQQDIILTLIDGSVTIANLIDVHTSYIKLVGYSAGTGTLTGIKMIIK